MPKYRATLEKIAERKQIETMFQHEPVVNCEPTRKRQSEHVESGE